VYCPVQRDPVALHADADPRHLEACCADHAEVLKNLVVRLAEVLKTVPLRVRQDMLLGYCQCTSLSRSVTEISSDSLCAHSFDVFKVSG